MQDATRIIIEELEAETGINALTIYCQVTGQPIGAVWPSMMDDILDSIDIDYSDKDWADDLKSELLIRTLASARPSPLWNKFRVKTFDNIRRKNPIGALSYLVNRAMDILESKDLMADTHRRVKFYAKASESHLLDKLPTPILDRLLMALLEIDARYNLLKARCPTNLIQLVETEQFEKLAQEVESWLEKLIQLELAALKAKKESDRSFREGNSITRQAYMQEFARQQPASPTRQAIIQKEAKRNDRLAFLDELEDSMTKVPESGRSSAAMSQPRAAQAPHKIRIGAVKLHAGFKFGGVKS